MSARLRFDLPAPVEAAPEVQGVTYVPVDVTDPDQVQGVTYVPVDVTNPDQVQAAVDLTARGVEPLRVVGDLRGDSW